jgi:hypothetical protein
MDLSSKWLRGVGLAAILAVAITGSLSCRATASNERATAKESLVRLFESLSQSGALKGCRYFRHCFATTFSEEDMLQIARSYGIIDKGTKKPGVVLGLNRGSSLDIGGIGTGHQENKSYLKIEDGVWYWEVGSCATNRRVYIVASTGEPGPIHKWVYCGGIE